MSSASTRAGLVVGAIALSLLTVSAQARELPANFTDSGAAAMLAGDYMWKENDTSEEPVRVLISLPLQRLYVYRGQALVGMAAVSTGREGHETPVGTFEILEKDADHRSNLYDDARMPYMLRLTWDGVAIHGGRNPDIAIHMDASEYRRPLPESCLRSWKKVRW